MAVNKMEENERRSAPQRAGTKPPSVEPTIIPIMMRDPELIKWILAGRNYFCQIFHTVTDSSLLGHEIHLRLKCVRRLRCAGIVIEAVPAWVVEKLPYDAVGGAGLADGIGGFS